MCIVNKDSFTACCYYDSDFRCLFYLRDYQDAYPFDIAQLLIQDVQPSVLITNEKCDPRFLRFLKDRRVEKQPTMAEEERGDNENSVLDFYAQFQQQSGLFKTLKIVSPINFENESAKSRIFSLNSLTGLYSF